jgi:hypothetical protein
MQQIVGRACLQSDGTWQFVQSPDGSVPVYPVAAYPYPAPWYWWPPLFVGGGVSFIFVDRFHHFRHFGHFHQIDHNHFGAPMGAGFHRGPFPGGACAGPAACPCPVACAGQAACTGSPERDGTSTTSRKYLE